MTGAGILELTVEETGLIERAREVGNDALRMMHGALDAVPLHESETPNDRENEERFMNVQSISSLVTWEQKLWWVECWRSNLRGIREHAPQGTAYDVNDGEQPTPEYVYVREEQRRQGIGGSLVQACYKLWPNLDPGIGITVGGQGLLAKVENQRSK